ncbi:MAG: restriction endonuclease subunit S [Mollicutes bacterium UO1]
MKNAAFSSSVPCLEPKVQLFNPNFLYYSLTNQKKMLENLIKRTSIPMTNKSDLSLLKVYLPSITKQTQILQKFQIVYNTFFQSQVIYQDFFAQINCQSF